MITALVPRTAYRPNYDIGTVRMSTQEFGKICLAADWRVVDFHDDVVNHETRRRRRFGIDVPDTKSFAHRQCSLECDVWRDIDTA